MELFENMKFGFAGNEFVAALNNRIVVLDGAMGTMIQHCCLSEEDFRGKEFYGWAVNLAGCNDVLCITKPEVIENIHRQYLEAGARVITTNSFNSNAVSLSDYSLEAEVTRMNLASARLARRAADGFMAAHPGEMCWVAGSVGPTSKSLTMHLGDPDAGSDFSWDVLEHTYTEQIAALIAGSADIILIETVFDTQNAKCALYSARKAMESCGKRVPVIVSATLTESGRTLSGQTLDALVATLAPFEPVAIGLNCGFGASTMMRYVADLQKSPFAVSVYPNAGLPNALGDYDESPEDMACYLRPMLEGRMLNMVGGCCGTTPEHIRAVAQLAAQCSPRVPAAPAGDMVLAGLEPKTVSPETGFVNVGERCNVAGSRKFLRLIKENSMGEAVAVARAQVDTGAQIIDVNMDDAMLDSSKEMTHFLGLTGVDTDVARVPLMIDSSDWNTIVAALKCVQGRPIVNSISLKEGEDVFLAHARHIRAMGAAVVVMAFDESGQADTLERRKEVAARSYRLLTERAGFKGYDIVIDPNVLAVATGIEDHNSYASDFLETIVWIKKNLPGAKVSGGISNLSFAFRGNNPLREAMHARFLYHAVARGMDMAIVNAAQLFDTEELEPHLRKALDDVIFNTDAEAADRLIGRASEFGHVAQHVGDAAVESESGSAQQRLEAAVVKGQTDGIDCLLSEVLAELGSALAVIDGPLMHGMARVGALFGEGRMFLPQVVKSARSMRAAVDWLTPYINEEKRKGAVSGPGCRMVLATVKGDVHDIGKNIVSVVMNCNGAEVTDLGVMVPTDDIIETALREKADFIGLSGLITPSLDEMCNVARQMQRHRMTIPLLIGGATTSALHTAVKIAPCYDGPVVYTRDAAALPAVVQKLSNPLTRDETVQLIRAEQQNLRDSFSEQQNLLPLAEARRAAEGDNYVDIKIPAKEGVFTFDIPLQPIRKLINWKAFVAVWGIEAAMGSYGNVAGCNHCKAQWLAGIAEDKLPQAREAMALIDEANVVLDAMEKNGHVVGIKGRVAIYGAKTEGDDIYVMSPEPVVLPMLRRQSCNEGSKPVALSDYVGRYIALFAVTAGQELDLQAEEYRRNGDEYKALVCQALSHRLAEAATEWTHRYVAEQLWGYVAEGIENVPGIRPAVGYPSLPDQSLVHLLDHVLDYRTLGIDVTEHGALSPSASTTGLILPNPGSRYFNVGHIGADQRSDYARRRGMTVEQLEQFLPSAKY